MFNKTLFKFLGGGAVLVLLGVGVLYAPGYWQKYRVDKAIYELERPYREDKYGGKTPEETFDMFLAALKNGGIELASKYFVVGKQGEYLERFEKMREDGKLAAQIQEWERARKEWVKVVDEYNDWKTRVVVRYKYLKETEFKGKDSFGNDWVVLPGEYENDAIFNFNELSSIWKIMQL